ncbi:elongation factor P 5-aminopentanone reductase [Saliterribacillus persicus]|uniref:3-oxoacyl-[acyl-carrier protein] reductase n=1 Tax=Saliterribacillus persicus TaxID=930114 RepID=A0A368XXB6_9BACI|nr:SDR family oxidoreductase [Saliterribacillus persicus]RCW70654.1 3-oxoacyl-[acyl-carrier protein] reductase [Saliterribacillus persicus]
MINEKRPLAVIIGASGDIGKAISKNLLEDDFDLILHFYKNREAIDHIIEKDQNNQVVGSISTDLSKKSGWEQLVSQLPDNIDAIIFASGTAYSGVLQSMDEETIQELIELNVTAPTMIVKSILPSMLQKQSGHVLFVTSIWGDVGASCEVVYSMVKGAQNSFVKALAKEVAPMKISVNAVSPGYIDTKMNDNLSELEKETLINSIPVQRAGKPEEVAGVISFLLDKKSSYIQGEIIHVNGAW